MANLLQCDTSGKAPPHDALDLPSAARYLGVAKVRVRRWAWKGLKSLKGQDGQLLFTRGALHDFLAHARHYNEKKARRLDAGGAS